MRPGLFLAVALLSGCAYIPIDAYCLTKSCDEHMTRFFDGREACVRWVERDTRLRNLPYREESRRLDMCWGGDGVFNDASLKAGNDLMGDGKTPVVRAYLDATEKTK